MDIVRNRSPSIIVYTCLHIQKNPSANKMAMIFFPVRPVSDSLRKTVLNLSAILKICKGCVWIIPFCRWGQVRTAVANA